MQVITFIYTNIELTEKEIMENASFITVPKNKVSRPTKYIGIDINKEEDFYNENLKSLKRETKEDSRQWKDLP